MLGVGVYLWLGVGIGVGCVCLCVYMCLSTPCNSPICTKILAAFLFKPLCPSCATSTIECSIVYARCVCYIVHMMHMVSTALEISSTVVRLFFCILPTSVGITACLGLFVSLAYRCGGSMAVMPRARLFPLCCIRQEWDWALCFISVHIKASTHRKRLRELFP